MMVWLNTLQDLLTARCFQTSNTDQLTNVVSIVHNRRKPQSFCLVQPHPISREEKSAQSQDIRLMSVRHEILGSISSSSLFTYVSEFFWQHLLLRRGSHILSFCLKPISTESAEAYILKDIICGRTNHIIHHETHLHHLSGQ